MFKYLITEVELAISLPLDPDVPVEFKLVNCRYKVYPKNLPRFLEKLKKGGVLHAPTLSRIRRVYHNVKNEDGSVNA